MTRKKGKQHVFKIYGAKSQRFVHRIEISKISSIAHKNDCKDKKKKDQMLWIVKSQMKRFKDM